VYQLIRADAMAGSSMIFLLPCRNAYSCRNILVAAVCTFMQKLSKDPFFKRSSKPQFKCLTVHLWMKIISCKELFWPSNRYYVLLCSQNTRWKTKFE